MISMYLGSGDTAKLLSGHDTAAHISLLERFVSNKKPVYNAYASPIDALRTGAILENIYYKLLPDYFYAQYQVVCKEMDVFQCTLDFAHLDNGNVIYFEELKTCNFSDFIDYIEPYRNTDYDSYIDFIKKEYKTYYNQIQQQLLCTGLNDATLVFLTVYSYDDDENLIREIKDNEYIKFKIKRDEKIINEIKERGSIFQKIKDYYTLKNK